LEKKAGTLRVVCMGDSCTMGWGVSNHETFCNQLRRLLPELHGKKLEVINAGVAGYTTFQGLHQLRTRILPLKPEIMIFSYNWNDHSFAIGMNQVPESNLPREWYGRPDRHLPTSSLVADMYSSLSGFRTFQLMQFLAMELQAVSKPSQMINKPEKLSEIPVRVPPEDYKRNLEEMISLSRANHSVPILISQPCKEIKEGIIYTAIARNINLPLDSREEFRQFYRNTGKLYLSRQSEYNEIMRKIASANHVPFVDVVPAFERTHNPKILLLDSIHPTAKGHQLIAEQLSNAIRESFDSQRRLIQESVSMVR